MNDDRYFQRFSRNIGILTLEEQRKLLKTRVGIAGLGGLGGQTFINLVRMGFGKFAISDLDIFETANTNRQIGATSSSLGKSKVLVMMELAKDINPDIEITPFHNGIQEDTVQSFVKSSDIVVDSLDFFCLTPRRLLYDVCSSERKTVILSAPLGFSATLHSFTNSSMSPNSFFNWTKEIDKFEQLIHFAVGIAPSGLHLKYLQFEKQKLAETGTGPSISSSCGLGAALISSEVLFHILNRRTPFSAPAYIQFDMLLGKYIRKKLLFGNSGLIQKFKIYFAKKYYASVKDEILKHIK